MPSPLIQIKLHSCLAVEHSASASIRESFTSVGIQYPLKLSISLALKAVDVAFLLYVLADLYNPTLLRLRDRVFRVFVKMNVLF